MSSILVIGGAGYIGSHMCKLLRKRGFLPIVLDNLVHGHREAVKWGPFIQGSLSDTEVLDQVFTRYNITAVMHFAAFCYVGESVSDPGKYYQNNVADTITLIQSMVERGISSFIFSSSAAAYGEPIEVPISESHPLDPINPYGRTKLMVEQILKDFERAYGLKSISLRYFNAAGADPDGEIGEDHNPETHLIPLVMQTALSKRKHIEVYGDDYPTRDGTCVRDYIHINDLAQAHLLALDRLIADGGGGNYNLGNGNGYTVKEVIETARHVTGRPIPANVTAKRTGDPAVLIASSEKARKELGWKPRFGDLTRIIETAWNWHNQHPRGYGD